MTLSGLWSQVSPGLLKKVQPQDATRSGTRGVLVGTPQRHGSGATPRMGLFQQPAVRGVTLIELVVSIAVLGVLAAAAMPLAQVSATRTRELELRRSLRKIREGIDQFKLEYDKARGNARDARQVFRPKISVDRTGYPLTLDELVETKVLRRIPRDPMTAEGTWVARSFSDNPDSSLSDAKDVYDIRSSSKAVGLDGTTYDTW